MCETCRDLLNEALNLAVRSEKFEQQKRREAALGASCDPDAWQEDGLFDRYVERHNIENPHYMISPISLTFHLWVQDQYNKDLAEWEAKSRKHLMQGCQP